MKRILVISYSQSGDVQRVADAFTAPLRVAGVELVWEQLRPKTPYPFPWKNIQRFFNTMPECILQRPPEIAEPEFDLNQKFDLIILAYQVWFLSPSLPVQGFFRTRHAEVLRGANVLTISVSRNMWHNASETMKTLLAQAGARQIDNIVVTHQGPPAATFVTTTRKLMSGKEDRVGGVLPEAGVAVTDLDRVARLGQYLTLRLDQLDRPDPESILRGQNAVWVNRRYVVPEIAAWHVFRAWAGLLHALGRVSNSLRQIGIFLFGCCLLSMILTLPLFFLGQLLITPFIRRRVANYIDRLYEPTGIPRAGTAVEPSESAVSATPSQVRVPSL